MLRPEDIKSEHPERDAEICNLYMEGFTPEEIKQMRKLQIDARRVQQIVYENKDTINSIKGFETIKQIARLKRQIRKRPDSAKDVIDIEKVLNDCLKDATINIHQTQILRTVIFERHNASKEAIAEESGRLHIQPKEISGDSRDMGLRKELSGDTFSE